MQRGAVSSLSCAREIVSGRATSRINYGTNEYLHNLAKGLRLVLPCYGDKNWAKSSGNRSLCWNTGHAPHPKSTSTIASIVNAVLALMLCMGLPVSVLTSRYLRARDRG